MNPRFNIINGPSKFDLMISLLEGNKPPRKIVCFSITRVQGDIMVTADVDVAITLIGQADGTGEAWVFKGYTRHPATLEPIGRIYGFYSSRFRSGWYQFEKENVLA